jgi:hypothetical protein
LVALARHLGLFDPKARQPLKAAVNIADVQATILSRLARIAGEGSLMQVRSGRLGRGLNRRPDPR